MYNQFVWYDFQAKYTELQAKEELGRALLLNGEDMLARCRDEDAVALKENLSRLQTKMYDTRNKSERRKVREVYK